MLTTLVAPVPVMVFVGFATKFNMRIEDARFVFVGNCAGLFVLLYVLPNVFTADAAATGRTITPHVVKNITKNSLPEYNLNSTSAYIIS